MVNKDIQYITANNVVSSLIALLLMESDSVTNCSQKLLRVARTVGIFFAKLLQLLLQTR